MRWHSLSIALASGAGEHVANKNIAATYTINEPTESKAGQYFAAASGARNFNENQFAVHVRNERLERYCLKI